MIKRAKSVKIKGCGTTFWGFGGGFVVILRRECGVIKNI